MDLALFFNAHLPGRSGLYCVEMRQGRPHMIFPMQEVSMTVRPVLATDLGGDWLSLGGIDLQINGALGLAFTDLTPAHLPTLKKIGRYLWQQGLDGYLPTLVTTTADQLQASLETLRQFTETAPEPEQASILGVHLEGPFLNPEKHGAHPPEHLQPLTLDAAKTLIGDYTDLVRIVTLAPELEPSGEVIGWLRAQQIIVSSGHSTATAAQAQRAFEQGVNMVTHAFNAMPSLHHREVGLLGAALLDSSIYCGLIADGEHVSPQMIDLLLRSRRGQLSNQAHHCENLFLVSDALAPLGLADGTYPWDQREVTVKQGTARLPDGTLAGTTRPLLDGVKSLVEWGVCDLGEAISMATEVPRQIMGLPGLQLRQPASLLRWHWDEASQSLSWERLDC
ncbi:MAG: N-acetylglucosamine-6-phosphate deacetylase [Leptolyngbya sp. SIO4C1]|nr:N-acetylglucosamine-6-phosphate deacetylase [Leptolyngbya sp. SIO4C1]